MRENITLSGKQDEIDGSIAQAGLKDKIDSLEKGFATYAYKNF